MKETVNIICCALMLALILVRYTGYKTGRNISKDELNGVAVAEGYLIPTRGDIQQRLVDEGYDIKVDCKIGKETLNAWERYEIDTFSERLELQK